MNTKGFSLHWIHMYYLLLLLVILIALSGRIKAAGDDSAYNLKFYSRDVAYGVEAFLWSNGIGTYVYPLKKGYELKIDNDAGYVVAKKGISEAKYSFRKKEGFVVEIYPSNDESLQNPYVIEKKMKGEKVA